MKQVTDTPAFALLREVLADSASAAQWSKLPLKSRHGVVAPLFSLHTRESCGIGEYPDLLELLKICSECGLEIVQLLPLNDTGGGASPYSAHSGCALNPLHLGLSRLLKGQPLADRELEAYLREGAALTARPRVDYPAVAALKERFLRRFCALTAETICSSEPYRLFQLHNPWLRNYALFKSLKSLRNCSWSEWPEIAPSEQLFEGHREEMQYHSLVQYLCFAQMSEVRRRAEELGILLKGDLPILMDRESAEVWAHQQDFLLHLRAGAPPDQYAPDGQDWGFPPYNWQQVAKENFSLWNHRLCAAEQLYHLYRLDHFVGFYRIWAIGEGKGACEGQFLPVDEALWIPHGEEILKHLLASSRMLPIAEDLGIIPHSVRESMTRMGICGTKVIRWERDWEGSRAFTSPSAYSPLSMTTLSTHDSPTLQQWWEQERDDSSDLERQMGWEPTAFLSRERRRQLIQMAHSSGSLFHIDLLQEYLPLSDRYCVERGSDRINIPGTVGEHNWSCRIAVPLEELLADKQWIEEVRLALG